MIPICSVSVVPLTVQTSVNDPGLENDSSVDWKHPSTSGRALEAIWKDSVAPQEPDSVPGPDGDEVVEVPGGKTTSGTSIGSEPTVGVGVVDTNSVLGLGATDTNPRPVADGPGVGSWVDNPPVGRAGAEGTTVGVRVAAAIGAATGCAVGSTTETGAGVAGAGAVLHPQSTAKSEAEA